jgi:hypothetical protein
VKLREIESWGVKLRESEVHGGISKRVVVHGGLVKFPFVKTCHLMIKTTVATKKRS